MCRLVAEALARREPVHSRLLATKEGLERLVVGHGLARRLVVGVGQVGEDHLAPRALRLQLQRQLAEVVAVGAAVGLVGRLVGVGGRGRGRGGVEVGVRPARR